MISRLLHLALVITLGFTACSASARVAAPKAAPPAAEPTPPPTTTKKEEPPLVIQDGANVSFPRFGFKWVTPHQEWKPEADPSAAVGSGGIQIQMTRDDLLTVIRFVLFSVPQADPTQTAESLKASIDPAAVQVTIGPVEASSDGLRAGFTVESTDPQKAYKDRITVIRPLGASDPLIMVVMLRTFDPSKFDAAMADLTALLDSIKPL